MSTEMDFVVHCIEAYKADKGLKGKDTYELFKKHGIIGYLIKGYDSLHTVGTDYIIDDIDKYISVRN